MSTDISFILHILRITSNANYEISWH